MAYFIISFESYLVNMYKPLFSSSDLVEFYINVKSHM